ncbi:MAG TPA: DUF2914 domain-containing protein [Persephonella sp.]|uniref:DUF2914 domain-containing protein n=1 Tax=Persephonella marina (strain DSM 14350 / EX-H1) TaxID=123214 RepID=C0QSZ2_PERMH|nr:MULTISPECIES: DUF2914 domain-containing protein [Persephonella]ACO04363.1 conserved hypothetical protein [Persephonella marina EX-H1]HCB70574.1 DUF2914 domain-containing protein [Persephonella sp.]
MRLIPSLIFSILMIITISKASQIEVIDMKFARDVVNREPVDVSDRFPPDIGRVYCWTKIKADTVPTKIYHVWYYNEKEMAKVELEIRYPVFRTWSYKTILPQWTGEWKVVVQDEEGNNIYEKTFEIKQ